MLEGVRILDLTQYLSGPSCTLLLAGLGADVIKVEPGPTGDMSRLLPVVNEATSSYFVQQNRGKRSVCIDLNKPEGHALVATLAAECDVLVENFSHGVLERRGLGPDALRASNPQLIYASISAYGRTGSKAHLPGFDLIGQAMAGTVAVTGEPDGPPIAAGAPIADVAAGMMAFGSINAALYSRTITGEGQFIDISMVEAIFNMHPFAVQGPSQSNGKLRLKRTGRHFGSVPPAGSYEGPDGWLVLQVLDAQWPRLCDAATDIGLGNDPRFTTAKDRSANRYALVEELEVWMQTFPSNDALLAHLEKHRLPAAPVIDPADAHLEPWFNERGAVTEINDADVGMVRVPGFPIHTTAVARRDVEPPAPRLGQHNAEVLAELLGYGTAEVDALVESGVVHS